MVGVRVKIWNEQKTSKKVTEDKRVTKSVQFLESAWKTDPTQVFFELLVERVDAENIRKFCLLLPNVLC